MSVSFASPAGALAGLAALLPLAALALVELRASRVRRSLGLRPPRLRLLVLDAGALVLVGALVAAACAQPLLASGRRDGLRADGEAYVVVDTSRSMLAGRAPGAATRIERAKALAGRLRRSLPDVPFGIATLTDRMLPHLFPTVDGAAFDATLRRAVAVDHPPPQGSGRRATDFSRLADAPTWNYFSPRARRRVLVVLTDGEGGPSDPSNLRANLAGEPRVDALFVHVRAPDEAVWDGLRPEPGYAPDPGSRALLETLAGAMRGTVDGEGGLAQLRAEVRRRVGPPVRTDEGGARPEPRPLAPWALGAALLPLGLLLARRNRA